MLLGAVLRGPRPLFWRVFERLREACLTPLLNGKRNKRGESVLSRWVLVVDRFDPARTEPLLQEIRGPVHRQQARETLQRYGSLEMKS